MLCDATPITSTQYGGRRRKLYPRTCLTCEGTFYAPKHRPRKYCSRKCAKTRRKSSVSLTCCTCGSSFTRKPSKIKSGAHGKFFCSRKCKDIAQSYAGNCPEIRPGHYNGFNSRYRRKAIAHYGARCVRCAYDAYEQMLDVHHRDENRKNNEIENLEVLCVWCHALETRGVPSHSREITAAQNQSACASGQVSRPPTVATR